MQAEMANAGLAISDLEVEIYNTPAWENLAPEPYSRLLASSSSSFGAQNTYSLAFRADLQKFLLGKVSALRNTTVSLHFLSLQFLKPSGAAINDVRK